MEIYEKKLSDLKDLTSEEFESAMEHLRPSGQVGNVDYTKYEGLVLLMREGGEVNTVDQEDIESKKVTITEDMIAARILTAEDLRKYQESQK